jgi:hypothetical protein
MAPAFISSAKSSVRQALRTQRMKTGRLRCLPDFIIIGTQRGGTSSLFNYLIQSPHILPSLRKEVHYFDDGFARGLNWYRAHFALSVHRSFLERTRGVSLVFEASPYYMLHPHAATRVRQILPHVKLIALLRNPVDRAESHYHHQVRRGRETLSFEEAIVREPERLDGEREKIAADPRYVSRNYRLFSYLTRGRYVEQLPAWAALFPPEQLHIIRSEDLFLDPGATVAAVLKWLGVPEATSGPFRKFNQAPYTRMTPSMRARLEDYFRPYNERLYEYLGRDMGWNQPSA